MIAYFIALAHGNPFAFYFIVGTVILGCAALLHPESHGGNRW